VKTPGKVGAYGTGLVAVFAGAAMAFSSVFVVSNSLRVCRFRPLRTAAAPRV
jgi:cation transport ATPase